MRNYLVKAAPGSSPGHVSRQLFAHNSHRLVLRGLSPALCVYVCVILLLWNCTWWCIHSSTVWGSKWVLWDTQAVWFMSKRVHCVLNKDFLLLSHVESLLFALRTLILPINSQQWNDNTGTQWQSSGAQAGLGTTQAQNAYSFLINYNDRI